MSVSIALRVHTLLFKTGTHQMMCRCMAEVDDSLTEAGRVKYRLLPFKSISLAVMVERLHISLHRV